MNRELIVNLLQKQIEELKLMTEGFSDMEKYPEAIIKLALIKNDDIRDYLHQLGNLEVNSEVQNNNKHIQTNEKEDLELITPEASVNPEVHLIDVQATEAIIEVATDVEHTEETAEENIEEIIEVATDVEHTEETAKENIEEIIEEIIEVATDVEHTEEATEENQEELVEVIEEEEEEFIDEADDEDEEFEEEIVIITPDAEKSTRPTLTRNDILNSSDISLNSSIGNKKITDIRQAISIGDRFRFQRELFRNNGEDMNKTLIYINQLASFEEVFGFLQSKYGWETENTNADDFYQIVKRKF